jgi:hypothetical protein
MNLKASKDFIEKYSAIVHKDFWFEVEDGWIPLVGELLEEISKASSSVDSDCKCFHEEADHKNGACEYFYSESYELNHSSFVCDCKSYRPLTVQLLQVKEKFGLLRVYVSTASKELNEIISGIEQKSAYVCEFCGKEGSIRLKGWRKVLCDSCEKEYYAEVKPHGEQVSEPAGEKTD